MKKSIYLIIALCFIFTLASCEKNTHIDTLYEVTNAVSDEQRISASKNAIKSTISVDNQADIYSGTVYSVKTSGTIDTYRAVTYSYACIYTEKLLGTEVNKIYKNIDVYVDETNIYDANVIGYDLKNYLAVIEFKAPTGTLEACKASQSINKAEDVIACSTADKISTTASCTQGIVSNLSSLYFDTDADLNFLVGYGAGVYNMSGEILGIIIQKNYSKTNTSGSSSYYNRMSVGLKYEHVIKSIALIENAKGEVAHPLMGITIFNYIKDFSMEEYTIPNDFTHAVVVIDVDNLCSGSVAGIKAGDIILSIDGYHCDVNEDLSSVMNFKTTGDKVNLEIMRLVNNSWESFSITVQLL